MLSPEDLDQLFPMGKGQIERTSDPDEDYNCIAWSVNDNRRVWWPLEKPNPFIYWPPGVPREETVHAFLAMYKFMEFVPCEGDHREEGYDKIALYALEDKPTHAARLWIEDADWSSKLGQENDVSHKSLRALEESDYGKVIQIMKRKRPTT